MTIKTISISILTFNQSAAISTVKQAIHCLGQLIYIFIKFMFCLFVSENIFRILK